MFDVTGTFNGRKRTIRWDDGKLFGDGAETLTEIAGSMERIGQVIQATPTGPYYESGYLSDPLGAAVFLAELLEDVKFEGDVPTAPPGDLLFDESEEEGV